MKISHRLTVSPYHHLVTILSLDSIQSSIEIEIIAGILLPFFWTPSPRSRFLAVARAPSPVQDPLRAHLQLHFHRHHRDDGPPPPTLPSLHPPPLHVLFSVPLSLCLFLIDRPTISGPPLSPRSPVLRPTQTAHGNLLQVFHYHGLR